MSSVHPTSSQIKLLPHMSTGTHTPPIEYCINFLHGKCFRGNSCHRHHDTPKHLELFHNRSNSGFDSSGRPEKFIPAEKCRDFLLRTCPRQNNCPFFHDVARRRQLQNVSSSESEASTDGPSRTELIPRANHLKTIPLCFDSIRNSCHRESCKFLHGPPIPSVESMPNRNNRSQDSKRDAVVAPPPVAAQRLLHGVSNNVSEALSKDQMVSTKTDTSEENLGTNPSRALILHRFCYEFYNTGRCRRGSNCSFRHDRPPPDAPIASQVNPKVPNNGGHIPEPPIPQPGVENTTESNLITTKTNAVRSSPATSKKNYQLSADDMRARRTPPNADSQTPTTSQTVSQNIPPRDPQLCEKTVLASTQVVFGPGGAVQTITTAFESRHVIINGLPQSIQRSRLVAVLQAFGMPQIISLTENPDKGTQSARVSFQDSTEAAKAALSLHGTSLDSHRLEANMERRGGLQTGFISRTTIQLSWDPPSRLARAIFDSPETARLRARDLNRSSFRGRRIAVSLDKHSADQLISRSVFVRGLPSDVDLPSLKRFFMAVHVTSWEVGNDAETIFTRLRSSLEEYGDVEHYAPYSTNDATRVEARFRLEEQAQRAVASLHRSRPYFLGGREIYVQALNQVGYTIPVRQYLAQSQDFYAVRQLKATDVNMKIKVQEHISIVRISITSHSTDSLSRFKARVELLTAGEKMVHTGLVVWDGFFLTPGGRNFLDRVFDETQTFIRPDGRKRCLMFYGAPTRKLQAKLVVQMELQRLEAQSHTVPLGRASLRYFCIRGLTRLRDELGVDNVKLDVTLPCVTIRGGGSALKELKLTIEASVADVSLNKGPTSSACPVCLGYVVDPSLLPCRHAYCTPCLMHLVKGSKSFPLTCLKEGCRCPIPLPSIRKLLTHTEFDELLDTSFLHFIQAHPNEFHYCPTADCPQIYRSASSADPPALQCPSCLIRICPYCHLGSHDGFNCQQYQNSAARREDERLFEEWKKSNDVKPCPACHTDLQKDHGCNHLTCTRCKTHICWACMATFTDNGGGVYEHMQEVHGGIGVPVDFVYDDDA